MYQVANRLIFGISSVSSLFAKVRIQRVKLTDFHSIYQELDTLVNNENHEEILHGQVAFHGGLLDIYFYIEILSSNPFVYNYG